MKYALVFPGQGSQYVGMGLELAKEYGEARAVFAEADDALGRSITDLIKEGPQEELTLTWNTQPAILTASIAAYRALSPRVDLDVVGMAGHSLGEYSALVAAGAMEFADAVRTVEKRGRFMQEAVPVGEGAMYAILGLEIGKISELCNEASTQSSLVQIANDNCAGQTVISGHADAAARAAEAAKAAGAKRAVKLEVSAPFHSSLMAPAAQKLSEVLAGINFKTPTVPVAANVDGLMNSDPGKISGLLTDQVSGGVKWQDCVRALAGLGAMTFVEIGPGKVLSGMLRRIERDLIAANFEKPEDLVKLTEGA
ncbi:MAG: [acyl-carrier-protein] S-malonyltransferase [Deltaproteobacteria bacterium]|nr:MAG: [acyl-carrier-protein] S-malonyltransferase [Deltaproteobacteria bacterium]